jgi:hypothetical protein
MMTAFGLFRRRAEKNNHHPSPPSGEYARATGMGWMASPSGSQAVLAGKCLCPANGSFFDFPFRLRATTGEVPDGAVEAASRQVPHEVDRVAVVLMIGTCHVAS